MYRSEVTEASSEAMLSIPGMDVYEDDDDDDDSGGEGGGGEGGGGTGGGGDTGGGFGGGQYGDPGGSGGYNPPPWFSGSGGYAGGFDGNTSSGFYDGGFVATAGTSILDQAISSAWSGNTSQVSQIGSAILNANGGTGALSNLASSLLSSAGISNNASGFVCFNAAALQGAVPVAGGICVTGTGDVWLQLGAGAPGLDGVIGFAQHGATASDVLGGWALSGSVSMGMIEAGGMISLPSGQTATFMGVTASPPPVSGSLTYGFSMGNIHTGLQLPQP